MEFRMKPGTGESWASYQIYPSGTAAQFGARLACASNLKEDSHPGCHGQWPSRLLSEQFRNRVVAKQQTGSPFFATGWKPILRFFLLRVFLCVLCASAFHFIRLSLARNRLEARFP
jgi:hypothetical protein